MEYIIINYVSLCKFTEERVIGRFMKTVIILTVVIRLIAAVIDLIIKIRNIIRK